MKTSGVSDLPVTPKTLTPQLAEGLFGDLVALMKISSTNLAFLHYSINADLLDTLSLYHSSELNSVDD